MAGTHNAQANRSRSRTHLLESAVVYDCLVECIRERVRYVEELGAVYGPDLHPRILVLESVVLNPRVREPVKIHVLPYLIVIRGRSKIGVCWRGRLHVAVYKPIGIDVVGANSVGSGLS